MEMKQNSGKKARRAKKEVAQSSLATITPARFEGVYNLDTGKRKLLLTKNLTPGISYFNEELYDNGSYRQFDARRSKLAASLLKGLSQWPLRKDSVVLYLGASHGYTPSFLSDICPDGFIFALDFAPRVVRDLVFVAQQRSNMAPLLADANRPEKYYDRLSQVDIIYQDVAQKNQAEIFLKNCSFFLKPGSFGFLAIKARSIDITKKPPVIYREIRAKLEQEMVVVDYKELDPFEKDHALFLCKKK